MLLLMCFWLLIAYVIGRNYFWSKWYKLPTPPMWPILGHIPMFFGKPEKIYKKFKRLTKKYNRMITIWFGPFLNVFICDPTDIEIVLKASKDMDKAFQYNFLRPWLGDSILLSKGEKFRQNKRILMQSFTLQNLRKYIPVFQLQATDMVNNLKVEVGKGNFDVMKYLSLYTMHTLLESSLGVDKDLLGKEALSYATSIEKVGRYVHMRTYKLWLYPDMFFNLSTLKKKQDACINTLNTLTNRVISKRRDEFQLKLQTQQNVESLKHTTFVDNFFAAVKDNGQPYSAEEIKDEVMVMMFAGQDTTTVTLGFILSILAFHQDIQEKILLEIRDVLGDAQRDITYEDLLNLKYMEQVINETLRMYPPFAVIAKTPLHDLSLGDCTIPKGATIAINIMSLHRNPKLYPNPHVFNPDNFSPENIRGRSPYNFIPFSYGFRQCIGPKYALLVIKIFLVSLLQKYVVKCDGTMKKFTLAAETTLRRKDGFIISLELPK